MKFSCLVGFVLFVQGCYLSSWNEGESCDALPQCAAGTRQVGMCVNPDCREESACGTTILCERECRDLECAAGESEVPWCDASTAECSLEASECGSIYCQTNLCNAIPSCDANEDQVPSCAGEADCRSVSVCGSTVYCASRCDVEPACEDGERMYFGACPPDESCTTRESCGVTIFCAEDLICESVAPCSGAPSSVIAQGGGLCPPTLPGPDPAENCYSEQLCGELHFCIVACNLDEFEVASPAGCWTDGICYSRDVREGETIWCTGAVCDVEPSCTGREEELMLGEECPAEWECRIVEACGSSIQCGYLPDIPG